ncbi:TRAP transporter small permease [Roseomonas sp. M0104]|uniref:TRAP transporter small permease protein n=1 Tax=Teichococcus coralli TaxID=2545983 RepID=A0A845B764_9PROT|nr:TRAP transporter small permease [Pseudoroseomonas coralli]MXP62545.1 TRAP transporter small permease [Pseudoroseomonas coralli]
MRTLERAEEALGVLLFAGVCLLVLLGALSRTVGMPLIWSIDMAQMLFAWTAVLGADVALKRWQHIEIDILVRLFPPGVRHLLAMVWLLAIAAFLATLVWLGVKLTLLNLERELGDAGISYGWVTAAIPAGAALMLITVVGRLVGGLRRRDGALNLEGRDGMVL